VRWEVAALVGCAVLVLGVWMALRGEGRSAGAAAIPAAQAAPIFPSTAAERTVAVLPFADMSPNRDHEYFADGITEELINALSRIEGLHVVARTSAFTFKGRTADVREIGAKLGAGTVLAGSIRQSGDRLRIAVQLVDARNGYQLWSETYDRKVDDVFAVQEEISRAVVRTVHPALLSGSTRPLVPTSTVNPAAYQLYMQGRYFWNERTEQGLRKSIDRFEQAIRLDPGYALAYSGLSDAHNALADNGYVPPGPALQKAEIAVRKALELDSELAEAYSSLAHLKLHRWDWAGAEPDFRRAIELNPGYAIAYQYYAFLLTFHSRFDEALPLIRRAQHLDPLSPAIQSNFGNILYLARRYPEAIEQLHFTLQMDSTRDDARRLLGRTLTELGRYDEAATELQRVIATSGGWHRSAVSALGYTYARAGLRAEAEQTRSEIESARRAGKTVSPYYYAGLLGAMGRRDEAFAMLDQAYTRQPNGLVAVAVDPMMDPLRSDPRFPRFLSRLGFTQ
jgi:TolB-like protein/Tfp pilus assembly protein PilF